MRKRKGLFSLRLNSGKKFMNKVQAANKMKKNNRRTYPLPILVFSKNKYIVNLGYSPTPNNGEC